MFDYFMFAMPLLPLLWAAWEDLRYGEFCQEHILESLLLAAFWKLLGYPNQIALSIAFGCFTLFIGLVIMHWRGWNLGDALFFGILGFILPPINIDYFIITAITSLMLGALADKLLIQPIIRKHFKTIYRRQKKDKASYGLWVVALVYIVFWWMLIAGMI